MSSPSLLLLLVVLACLVGTLCLVPKRDGPGRRALIGVLCASIWWSACELGHDLALSLEYRALFRTLIWLGVSAVPGSFGLLLWDTTFMGRRRVPRALWMPAVALAVLVDGAAAFNPHRLMFGATLATTGYPRPPDFARGPLWYVFMVMTELEMLGMIVYTALHQRGRSLRRRRIYLGVVLATLAPMIMAIVHATRILHIFPNDPAPFAFLVSAPVLAWLLTRNQLCDPMPIARSALLDVLPDAVIVLDADGRLAEANPPARGIFGLSPRSIGMDPTALPHWSGVIAKALAGEAGPLAVKVPLDPPRYYELSATRLEEDAVLCGHMLVVRDMTHRQRTEVQLRAALEDLHAQLTENLRLQGELRGQARRDPLTNLLNRRALDETLPVRLAEAARDARPLSVVMIDIDHFKAINDAFGHGFGDAVLKAFAQRLQSMSRPDDMMFRAGGEEFLALLPNTALDDAVEVARRWLEAFRVGIPVEDGVLRLTFSAGVAAAAADRSSAALIADADTAAYAAKRNGRNCVLAHKAALA